MAILTRYYTLDDQTPSSPSSDSIATPREKWHPETCVNILARSNGRIKIYGPFEELIKSGWLYLIVAE